MGWIGGVSYSVKKRARVVAPQLVVEPAGFVGEYVTPAGSENLSRAPRDRLRLKRGDRIVRATRPEALEDSQKELEAAAVPPAEA